MKFDLILPNLSFLFLNWFQTQEGTFFLSDLLYPTNESIFLSPPLRMDGP